MAAYRGQLVFSASDGLLRKSDGTMPGTTGAGGSSVQEHFVHAAGRLYLSCASNFVNGICVSDGAAPALLKQLSEVNYLTAVNDRVFFSASTTKSRSLTASSELAVTPSKPSSRAVASRSSG